MKRVHLLIVPALLAAMLSVTGCGAGDLKIGQSAVINVDGSKDPKATFEVTVKSLVEAPADVVASYELEDKLYFATVEAKLADPSKASGTITGVGSWVFAKLSDGNYLDMMGSGPDECTGSLEVPSQASADFLAGKTVTICVPLSADDGKDVVGVYVGPRDVNSGVGKVWAKS
jgi:hypothetical protein